MLGIRFVIIREAEVGLFYENGRFIQTLTPGRYALVNWPWHRQEVVRVDTRRATLTLSGQEMLTADGVSLRLNVVAQYRVVDGAVAVNTVADYQATLYTALQLLLREEVQSRILDALLGDRSALSGVLLERGRPEAAALGLELLAVGVRDVILPGEVKRMLTQEIQAQRAGRAALVTAREETAATRARANTARLLAENPVLLRLREIEALTQVAEGEGNTVVLALPAGLLAGIGAGKAAPSEG
ncbi:MAG: slipin family protein [Armatimonadetes bacterium]|nr:slipin family protein [Armatimonadota bacterium]